MSDDPKNPSPRITEESKWNSDLYPRRKKTLRDYLGAMTSGDPAAYSNKAELKNISIEPSMKNEFPINPEPSHTITNKPEDGLPLTTDRVKSGQVHFIPNTKGSINNIENSRFDVESGDPNSEIAEIFNDISSNSFFNYEQLLEITGDVDFKNTQTFGHTITKKVVPISQQVSAVLRSNRFFPGVENKTPTMPFSDKKSHKENKEYYNKQHAHEFAKLAAQANLAASGYVGDNPEDYKYANKNMGFDLFDKEEGPDKAIVNIWSDVISQIGYAPPNDLGGSVSDAKMITGAQRVKTTMTIPKKEWLNNISDRIDDSAINWIDSNGRPSTWEGKTDNEFSSYGTFTNYADQFSNQKIFGKHHVMSITWMTAIFVQSLVTAATVDALHGIAYATLLLPYNEKLKINYDSQIKNENPTLLRKGRSRGYVIEQDILPEDVKGIMDLLGVPDLDELLSGPFLVDLLMDFMGLAKPINASGIEIDGNPMGIFLSYTASHIIGALQTFILALKDPWSGGFFANLGRAIARNTNVMEEALLPNSVLEGSPMAFIDFVMKLPESYAFRWFKTMVNIGNNSIGQFKAQKQNSVMGKNPQQGYQFMSRQKDSTNPKGFYNPLSNFNIESRYLLPESFKNANKLTNSSDPSEMANRYSKSMEERFKSELSSDDIDKLEKKLNSSHMPFHIKDLRTNELIGFHAFLDSYSDSWSANYSDIKGVGRIEAAPIYDSASRSISFAFTMAAFSQEDMDYMYWKLNKLVTLLYPQWSKGTEMKAPTIEGGKKTFYMPFSQIPTASPMIRVRIGDVLTNNYSDKSAMRLMGLGDSKTKSTNDDNTPLVSGDKIKEKVANVNTATFSPFVLSVGGPKLTSTQNNLDQPMISDLVSFGVGNIHEPGNVYLANVKIPSIGLLPATLDKISLSSPRFTILGVHKNNKRGNKPVYIQTAWKIIGFSKEEKGKIVWLEKHVYVISDPNQKNKENASMVQKHFNKDQYKKLCVGVPYNYLKNNWSKASVRRVDIEKEEMGFLVGNPLIRSFENNKGTGMAGFITSLGIDWQLNSSQWDDQPGYRAPKLIKVSCNFKPIHDITPGIDADGFNRAPVYKIGDMSNSVHEVNSEVQRQLNGRKKVANVGMEE